jgi:hypothetical protein
VTLAERARSTHQLEKTVSVSYAQCKFLKENVMHPVIAKTFGGLSPQYYFRHFLFGLIFPAMFLYASRHEHEFPIGAAIFFAVNTFLYPYSRFVYESVVGFLLGNNVFFLNALVMLFVKLVTMALCWTFAIFISPIGLVYLYYYHSKRR